MLIPNYMPRHESPTFRLYSKTKQQQWDAARDIDWTLAYVPDPEIAGVSRGLARELDRFYFSQVFFGEQAAMMTCGQLLQDAPDMESRLYLAAQVNDEARHVEVFGRLSEMLGGVCRARSPFLELFERAMGADLYEARILGSHVLVEGAALIAFRAMRKVTQSPLIASVLDSVIRDEVRHTGFGETLLRVRANDRSPALRKKLEDTMGEWWRLYASGFETDDANLLKLLPPRVREMLKMTRRRRLEELATIQDEIRARLRRYGLELRAEPVRPDLGRVA